MMNGRPAEAPAPTAPTRRRLSYRSPSKADAHLRPLSARQPPLCYRQSQRTAPAIGTHPTAAQSGEVASRTTELVTDVYSREVTQAAKWSAKNTPEAAANNHSVARSLRNSFW